MGKGNLAHEQPSSTGWGALFSVHTAKDVCAAAVTPPSPSARPSVYIGRRPEGPGRMRSAPSGQHQFRVEPNLEPQVLFVHPPDKQLPLSFQGSPSEDRNFRIRSDVDSADTEEAPFSGQEGNEQNDILDWAKMTILHMAGSTVDLMSCSTSFELAKAHRAFALEEAATALSVWAISCLCGSLRLDHVLRIFAGALLEKQIMFSCLCALICTSYELANAHRAFALEEEATALSVWAISCLCGSLRLDHVFIVLF
ncbi:hypothetical protein Tco_1034862 [Tanacetum coccineum]